MQLVDSHCHLNLLDLTDYGGDLAKVVELAMEQGITHFLCPGVTLEDFPAQLEAIERWPGCMYASVGLHPNEVIATEPDAAMLAQIADHPRVIAIGETGLDYYRLEGDPSLQQERFRRHIRAARETGKPLIVHSRQAREDTIRLLREEKAETVRGILHCFTEDLAMAEAAIAMGFYISFSGIVTFANAKELHEVAKRIPL